jgi:lambda family phage portal protein
VSEQHSTIRATERWNPIVARWEPTLPAGATQAAPTDAQRELQPGVPAGTIPMKSRGSRMYAAARNTRLTGGFGSGGNSSADAELQLSLTQLRARSRQMVRDSAYAKRAKQIVVNNVIGTGVGMQAQVMTTRDTLADRINDDIEAQWAAWCAADSCHTGGALHFHDLERAAIGQVFEAGEVFIRKHYAAAGASRVPLVLELIESERVPHEIAVPGAESPLAEVRMGIEVDRFGRAIAYWVRQRHPGDIRASVGAVDRFERVPAADMFHLRLVDRWPQTRGEPWMHTALRKLDDLNEASAGELAAVRASSYYFGTIKTPEQAPLANEVEEADEQGVMAIEPLTIQELKPGEEFDFHAPNRPNAGLDAFLRHMLREVAAGTGPGISYESLSKDYSQGNYSNSRLGLLDDRDAWKFIQQWWIRGFRRPLHAAWLQQAVLRRALVTLAPSQYAVDPVKFEAVLFKPRGWSWVDPTKEVTAYKEAIKAGFTTLTDVIAATASGLDIEDIVKTRKRELELLAAAGIEVDTTIVPPPVEPSEPSEPDADDKALDGKAERALQVAVKETADRATQGVAAVRERQAFLEGKVSADQALRTSIEQTTQQRIDTLILQLAGVAKGLSDSAVVFGDAVRSVERRVTSIEALVPKAAPLYVKRTLTNPHDLIEWAKAQGFTSTLPAEDLHVTVVYSRAAIAPSAVLPAAQDLLVTGGTRSVERLGDKGAVVLKFACPELSARWQEWRNAGASWDHESYQPHVTITYQADPGMDLSRVTPFAGELAFGPELAEALNLDKADEYVEKAAA